MRSVVLCCFMITFLFSSCALLPYPKMEVDNAWIREAKISSISAGDLNQSCVCDIKTGSLTTNVYLTIHNNGGGDDRLLKVESAIATRIEMRRSGLTDDLVTLEPVDSIEIPAGAQIAFAPGEYVLVVMGIREDLKPGDSVPFTLFFEKSGALELQVEVHKKE